MRITSGAVVALLLAGIGWPTPAPAQGVPQGTYSRSCTNVSVQGDSLVATCRSGDGREQRTTLAGFRRCVGDIGNSNGSLQCSFGGGGAQPQGQAQPTRQAPQQPGYGAQPSGQMPSQPGYGTPR